jgi:predicted RNase H-like HicB family nuclease
MKYAYPLLIHPTPEDKDWKYWAEFPDLDGCYTEENTIPDLIRMARDAASGWLCLHEKNREDYISPTMDLKPTDENDIVTFIDIDTTEYRRLTDSRSVKKTLSIPNWLNVQAEKAGVNFSQILQEGLKQKLGII